MFSDYLVQLCNVFLCTLSVLGLSYLCCVNLVVDLLSDAAVDWLVVVCSDGQGQQTFEVVSHCGDSSVAL